MRFSPGHSIDRRRATVFALALLIAALAITLAATASAHHGEPATGGQEPGEQGGADTDWTPVGKDGEEQGWRRIAGAKFGADGVPNGSPTAFDLDFYAASFRDEDNGLFAGARCRRDDPAVEVASEETADCQRVPVIWRYRARLGEPATLKEVYVGADDTDPGGFVGGLTWLGPERALAVGGTGTYPRREHGRATGESDAEWAERDPAGDARAWLLEDGRWRELGDLPGGMRGMSALDASHRPVVDCAPDDVSECAIAGALGQLWRFTDGAFDPEPITTAIESSEAGLESEVPLRFRVREVRFAPPPPERPPAPNETVPDDDIARAGAVSSGCCGQSAADADSRWLVWDRDGVWRASAAGVESLQGLVLNRYLRRGELLFQEEGGFGAKRYYRYYEEMYVGGVAGPGAPATSSEPAASLTPSATMPVTPSGSESVCQTIGCTVRLHATDGDLARACSTGTDCEPGPPDGVPDWSVGVLRSSGQGIAYTTVTSTLRTGGTPLTPPNRSTQEPDSGISPPPPGCQGDEAAVTVTEPGIKNGESPINWEETHDVCTPGAFQDQLASSSLLKLNSYALNAFRMPVESTGWAAGDHGAIMRLGSGPPIEGVAEPVTPVAQTPPARFSERAPYDDLEPATTDVPGLVPALAGRPREQLDERRWVAVGSPDAVSGRRGLEEAVAIAMSRDGSEGWAIGPGRPATGPQGPALTLHRYDGERWSRCAIEPIESIEVQADPACSALAQVRQAGVGLTDLARVPLENDDDPTNDDELELVAVGTEYQGEPVMIRYREGRWDLDRQAMAELSGVVGVDVLRRVVFVAPDDGWATGGVQGTKPPLNLFHLDEAGWVECAGNSDRCDDPAGRLSGQAGGEPTNKVGVQLATAGQRTYLFSTVAIEDAEDPSNQTTELYPRIIYRDRGGIWRGGMDTTADGVYNPTDGGWYPGCVGTQPGRFGNDVCAGTGRSEDQGRAYTVAVAQELDGTFAGWATGQFSGTGPDSTPMLRLLDGRWERWEADDAARDYLAGTAPVGASDPRHHLALPTGHGVDSFLFRGKRFPLAFNDDRQRWEPLPKPWWRDATVVGTGGVRAAVPAVAPDNRGGLWATARQPCTKSGALDRGPCELYFYNLTDAPPAPVFADVPHPAANGRISALGAGPDGSLWLGVDGGLYRYDRLTGWEPRATVPGWDPERATSRRAVLDIAIGPGGRGIAVGEDGRIANVAPDQVQLDAASGRPCAAAPGPPCGTGVDLLSVSVAPDGSAIATGEELALLWRSPGGQFRSIRPPAIPARRDLIDVSMPRGDRAYVISDDGHIFAGKLSSERWEWSLEALIPHAGFALDRAGPDLQRPLNAIEVDAAGHGYAVGNDGIFLERTGDGAYPWRRMETGLLENLRTVALPAGGGEGALVGGQDGLVLTVRGREARVANPADPFDYVNPTHDLVSEVVGVALAPGVEPDEVEAWVVAQNPRKAAKRFPRPQALLHYSSDPDDPLLDPTRGLTALPDAPDPEPGELAFAAFGNQECQRTSPASANGCIELEGSGLTHEVIAQRVVEEITDRADGAAGLDLALFTGDISDAPGAGKPSGFSDPARTPYTTRNDQHRRWIELVADPLADGGVPLFGAIGLRDLGEVRTCRAPLVCPGTNDPTGRGSANNQWRRTMAAMPAPWEQAQTSGALRFERLPDGKLTRRQEGLETEPVAAPEVNPPLGIANSVPSQQAVPAVKLGGADTHYAVDVLDESSSDRKIARIVVVDTSHGSLAASDPHQAPVEPDGQAGWLERVLCIRGSATDVDGSCTREPDQRAIVLSTTPTYTYAPIPPTETQTDATSFEAILMRNRADAVVSGSLGWNGRYWATATGVHEPCPGQAYVADREAPEPGTRLCGQDGGEGVPEPAGALGQGGLTNVLPFVVSSIAGGNFNERAERGGFASAENGFWQGYSIVRLHPSGDPAKTIVEQRPVLDWVYLEGQTRVIRPQQKADLDGVGREVFGTDTTIRFVEIPETGAVTHRYELLLADPERPWVPLADQGATATERAIATQASLRLDEQNPCGPYVCLDPEVATIDDQTGAVRAGAGNYPRTYAIATLSVGEHVASYPLVFEPRPSFRVGVGAAPSPPASAAAPPPPPPPGGASVPQLQGLELPPGAPPPVVVPPAGTAQAQPPAPPAPPPPPGSSSNAPIDLFTTAEGIAVSPQTTVPPPPPPPVNPAPPGGARREARQRQAAAQKGGADSGADEGSDARELGGDMAQSPDALPGASADMTRHRPAEARRRDRARPEPSFTPVDRSGQPSAWSRTALYGGGATLGALILALGWATARPTPRRRAPRVPAPETAHAHARRR